MVALRIEGLDKRFGRTHAVRGVSLSVDEGQVHGLLGPNGSGKTTTLRCLLGMLRPDHGTIEVLGHPVSRIHRTAGRVAVVFDRPQIMGGLSVAANLAWARQMLGHRGGRPVEEALELVGIRRLAGQKAGSLSLGQGRRLSIARALIGKPEVLILDEPLSGLDAVAVRAMLALFSSLAQQGLTLLVSSHRLHELERIVSHVTIILDGLVVRAGTLAEVLSGPGDRLVVRTPQRAQALTLLGNLPDTTLHADAVQPDLLHVEGAPGGAAAVAQALVAGGCPLHELFPERRTLASVFDDLVDDRVQTSGALQP